MHHLYIKIPPFEIDMSDGLGCLGGLDPGDRRASKGSDSGGPGVTGSMLEGVRIVDLTSVVFGPYATQMMADLGADVIKVEPPAGDQFRQAGRPAHTHLMGACHMTINRGKRSVVLDLKHPEDAKLMRELIATADVFIHNLRGAAIDRLGLGYDSVKACKPDLIYVHCVGFGSGGPYSELQAYDDVIQAGSGAASLLGRVDGDPRPRYLPSLIADKVAGLHGAYAILAALVHRLRTGQGQFVEAPMFESFTHFMLEEHLFGAVFVPPTGKVGYPRQLDPTRQPFPTADGHISIVPYTDESVVRLISLLGLPDVLAEPRLATPRERARNMALVYATIAELTPARTTAEWMVLLKEAQIPALPVRDLADMLDDPHLQATRFFDVKQHPSEGAYVEMRPPVRFGVDYQRRGGGAPLLGEHTESVRDELKRPTT
jgi:crotonobetainyl-CoA:carnitine CoA-transferase CaiB-like acyl-CoA transferase